MIDIENFWDSNYYNHPDLTDEILKLAESRLGLKLPESYINLLKVMNGGYTKGFVYPMNLPTSWAENHVPLDHLNGIVNVPLLETGMNIMDTEYMINEWGLPEKQILLSGDGHYWITLDYREKDIPSIRWIDVECDEDIHIADNFDDFLNGLISDELYAE